MANLDMFKKECEYWISYFGLLDWDIAYDEKKLKARATYSSNLVGRVATLTIDNTKMEEEQIKKSAFHEICHLLISELSYYTTRVTDNSEEIQHIFIRRMENSVFKTKFEQTN